MKFGQFQRLADVASVLKPASSQHTHKGKSTMSPIVESSDTPQPVRKRPRHGQGSEEDDVQAVVGEEKDNNADGNTSGNERVPSGTRMGKKTMKRQSTSKQSLLVGPEKLKIVEPTKPEWLQIPPDLEEFLQGLRIKTNQRQPIDNISTSNDDKRQVENDTSDFTVDIAWNKYPPYVSNDGGGSSNGKGTAGFVSEPNFVPLDETPKFSSDSPALCFHLHAICGRARAGTVHFHNGTDEDGTSILTPPVPTPRFMPVGTKGTLKGILPMDLPHLQCPMILANTYHLAIQPGTDLIHDEFGGLPSFMGGFDLDESNKIEDEKDKNDTTGEIIALAAKGGTLTTTTERTTSKTPQQSSSQPAKRRLFGLLTDSGGFQMVSLADLSLVTEEGVVFESPYTKGEYLQLRPEDSIHCQNDIGANVIMQLDDVISSKSVDQERYRIATFRTLRWYDRCVKAHERPNEQNLFPILQGHLDISPGGLRELCLAGFRLRDERKQRIPGFAIGGLAGGESKDDFWKVVDHACRHLPDDRPRYLMGVGYPLDLVVCTALGVDMYDCVYPTRTARFGVALLDSGTLRLKQFECAQQMDQVIDPSCPCPACSGGVDGRYKISRGRFHQWLKANNPVSVQLLTQHNVTYMMRLVTRMRQAIIEQRFPKFCQEFFHVHFGSNNNIDTSDTKAVAVPQWVQDAMNAAGISLNT